jgi:hypothetical protein
VRLVKRQRRYCAGPSWAWRWVAAPDLAAARVKRVIAYHRARRAVGLSAFAGLHFDIEPHTEEAWACGDRRDRREITLRLQALFGRVAAATAEVPGTGLRLTGALPWWLGPLSAEVPEAAPAAWLAHLDEIVLMAYGDPGGPVVGGSAASVLSRLDDVRLWGNLPAGRGLRVGLATYEYPDGAALLQVIRDLVRKLESRPGFHGTAIFALGQPFDAPLVTSVSGRVVDGRGQPVAGALVRAGGQIVHANRCGQFGVRGLAAPRAELVIEAPGFVPRRVPASGLVAGRERELAPIALEPAPP